MRLALLLLVGAFATACVENDESLILARFVPSDPSSMCAGLSTSMVNQTQGLLDVGIVTRAGTRGYVTNAVVINNLPSRIAGAGGGIENNNILVNALDVELHPSTQLAAALPESQRSFRVTSAGGLAMPAMGAVVLPAEIVPAQIAALLAPTVQTGPLLPVLTVRMRPVGNRGGDEIIGAPVDFPVELCNFCLTPQPQPCPTMGIPMGNIQLGNQCFEAQDASITCCTSSQGQLLCGAQVPVAM